MICCAGLADLSFCVAEDCLSIFLGGSGSSADKRRPRPLRTRAPLGPLAPPTSVGGAREEEAPLLRVALPREGTRLCRPLGGLPRPGAAARLRLGPPREGELETAEKHPSLRASDAAVHALPEESASALRQMMTEACTILFCLLSAACAVTAPAPLPHWISPQSGGISSSAPNRTTQHHIHRFTPCNGFTREPRLNGHQSPPWC